MSRYRRPRRVSDAATADNRLLAARVDLVELVFGKIGAARKIADGGEAVRIRNAIETLEAAAMNVGALEATPAPYVPVSPAEIAEVKRALNEFGEELARRRQVRS